MIQPKIGCVAVILHLNVSLNSAVIVRTKPSTFFTAASASPFDAWLPGGDCLIEICVMMSFTSRLRSLTKARANAMMGFSPSVCKMVRGYPSSSK